MREGSIVLLLLAMTGCAASRAAPGAPTRPAEPSTDVRASPPPLGRELFALEPDPEAPAELAQYGRLAGRWRCQLSRPEPDGSWKKVSASTWTFFFALGGRAIQDVWVPDGGGPVGSNLRLYNPASGAWTMVWASAGQTFFDEFTARADGDDIVMHGERRAREAFGAHRARIRFFDVTGDRFRWSYHATAPGADGPWQPIQLLQCERSPET